MTEPAVTDEATLDSVIDRLPAFCEAARSLRQTLLANLVMTGEIPAPTFGEQRRVRFIQDRFCECGLQNCSTDDAGNALGILAGSEGKRNILVVAHADTIFPATQDHTITVKPDCVIGPGVGDNSLGVAAIQTLPTLIERLGLRLRNNLVLMGASRSLGYGNLEGLRFFLAHFKQPIRAGVCVEGMQLGRLSYASIGMLRGEITVEVPEAYDWTRFGVLSAVSVVNDVINKIHDIPLPAKPRSSILLGSVYAGSTFNTTPTHATLRFEIRSESADIVQRVHEAIVSITEELSAQTGAQVALGIVALRDPGGVSFAHPLVRNTRLVMEALGVEPRIAPSMSELTTFIHRQIPAVTLGVTTGENLDQPDETVFIEPMFAGMAQLIAVLVAIDEGLCHEP
jgi:tripeptide aminopeptidase